MYVSNKANIIDYDHPFNVTLINDNSGFDRTKTEAVSRVNFLNVFMCGKGRDNKLLRIIRGFKSGLNKLSPDPKDDNYWCHYKYVDTDMYTADNFLLICKFKDLNSKIINKYK